MRAPLSLVPSLPAALGLAAGVALGAWHPAAVVCAAVAGAVALYFAGRGWWAAVLLFIAVGAADRAVQEPAAPPSWAMGHKGTLCGAVESSRSSDRAMTLLLRVHSIDHRSVSPFLAEITVYDAAEAIAPGTETEVRATLEQPPAPPHIPGLPDLSSFRLSSGIIAAGSAQADSIHALSPPGAIRRWLNSARHSLASAIVRAPWSRPCAEFMLAVLIGDDSSLPPDTKLAFRSAGISHILALSGLHAGIIVALAMLLTMPLNLLRGGISARRAVAVGVVWAYAAIAGLGPSVTRAAVMVTALMIARTIGRGHYSLNSLLLAVIGVLVCRPLWLYSAGFQLSVCAVAAIIAFASLLPRRLDRRPWLKACVMAAGIPIAAMTGTGLISALHFGAFPLLFLPANIVTGLLATPLIGIGAIVAAGMMCGWQFTALAFASSWLFRMLDGCASLMAAPSWAVARVEQFPVLTFAPYVAALMLAWLAARRRSWCLGVASTLALATSAAIFFGLSSPRPQAELYSIPASCGGGLLLAHGDSAWILPTGGTARSRAPLQGFLRLRTVQDSFAVCPHHLRRGPLLVRGNIITIGAAHVQLLGIGSDCTAAALRGARTHYLLLGPGYRGDVVTDVRIAKPDTLLLAPDMHPLRRKAIISRAAHLAPIRDLRDVPLKIIIP